MHTNLYRESQNDFRGGLILKKNTISIANSSIQPNLEKGFVFLALIKILARWILPIVIHTYFVFTVTINKPALIASTMLMIILFRFEDHI